ncbi:hypothetical protein CNR27_01405 [Luteimonas chenhongjianii]|uniref:General stress protein FMN-binding split barrel domain-containing protein n=1 Tax=Luteimonas chenhongjianii TaxID=2006110 RepID=A0A290XB29_9GAMM|nr:hypothetical protein CNR27_01405 [Luteimonas chenhongjianii]
MAAKSKGAKDAQTIAKLIEDIDITMFTSVGPGGYLVSRPLSTQKARFDGSRVWFFVASDSPKVAEITRNSKVNLAYASKGRNTYVSMAGDAYVNDDPEKIEEFWDDALKAYFPRGVNDPKLTLIEVQMRTAEYWDGPGSLIGKAIAFAVAQVTRRKEAMGENRIVDLRGGTTTSRLPPSHAQTRGDDGGKPATKKIAGGTTASSGAKRTTAKKSATGSPSASTGARANATPKASSQQATTKRPAARKPAAGKTAPSPRGGGAKGSARGTAGG